jgi:transcriptional regulator with XRE-family HTH domain
MDKVPFSEWLRKEMDARGMTQAELARKAGTSRASINQLVLETRGPGHDLCNGIAKAFRIPPEVVFHAAGLMTPTQSISVPVEISSLSNTLTSEQLREWIDYGYYLMGKNKNKGE